MNAQFQYLQMQVQTASPGELTLMLFNGCIRFMKQADECLAKKDYEGKHRFICRAQDIIDELLITLNNEYELSEKLAEVYRFISEKLLEANVKLNRASLQLGIRMMTDLRNTWVEAIKISKTTGQAQG